MKAAAWIMLLGCGISLGIVGLRWGLYLARGAVATGTTTADGTVAIPSGESFQRRFELAQDGATKALLPSPDPLQPGQPVPDAVLVNQDGREFRLSELRGSVVVLAFVYTHCRVTSMCPLVTAKLVEVQNLLRKRRVSGVRLLLVSFDTERDRPRRLKEFSTLYGTDLSNFTFATGDAAQVASLSRALNTYYRQSAPGVFEHNIVVSLVDRQGILRDDFFGTSWEAKEMIAAIEKVGGTFATNP